MLGQPPSELEPNSDQTGNDTKEDSLEQDLKQLYSSVGLESFNPYGFWIEEKPDDGESLLMDGTTLFPPSR